MAYKNNRNEFFIRLFISFTLLGIIFFEIFVIELNWKHKNVELTKHFLFSKK